MEGLALDRDTDNFPQYLGKVNTGGLKEQFISLSRGMGKIRKQTGRPTFYTLPWFLNFDHDAICFSNIIKICY